MLQPTRLISTPFAQEGDKTEIQNVTGEFDNSATYRLGFPPLTMQSIRLGGKPPKGTDFNGILFDITENISFLCKGGRYQYNAGLSTLIGGYPEGSNLLLDDNVTEVVSTVAGNQNNPNTDMTGWTFKPNRTTAEYVLDATGKSQQEVNDNQARLNFSTIDNLANSTISSGGAGTLWAAGAAIFQELAPSATNQSLTTASGVKLAYITPFLKTQVDGDARTVLDIAHYSKQGSSPVASPNAVSIHDYTDAPRSMQIDKVGGSATDYVLGLRRASNAIRRPDKTAEYIGGAGFLRCSYDKFTDGVKSEVLAFYIGPNANFGWSSDPASFVTAKANNGVYAFTYSATVEAQYVASFSSASGQVLNIQDAISGTRTDIIAPVNQTSGIRIEATGGGIDIAPKSGSPITMRGNINSTNGTDLTITAVNSTLNINATNGIKSLAPHRFALYNMETLPAAANFSNHMILVTNGDAGQPCLAVSNGTSWLRIPLGAAVSAT